MSARLLLLLAVLALVVWLAMSSDPQEQLRQDLNRALATGRIGRLKEEQHHHYSEVLGWWAKAAGIEQSVLLDRPFDRNALNVYTIDSPIAGLAKVEPGNAIYDPHLDAIFISIELFEPTLVVHLYGYISIQGRRDDPPRLNGYLLFLYLHELGHRVLHRPPPDGLTFGQLEDQADSFAVGVMKNAYQSHVPVAARPSNSHPYSHLGQTAFNPRQNFFSDLAGSIHSMTDVLLHTEAAVSPYFRDKAHKTFVSRASGIVAAALSEASGASDRAFVSITREHLARVEKTAHRALVEIHAPASITLLGFTNQELIVYATSKPKRLGREYRVPWTEIGSLLCLDSGTSSSVGPAPTPEPHAEDRSYTGVAQLVQTGEQGTLELHIPSDGWYRKTGDKWKKRTTPSGTWNSHDGRLWIFAGNRLFQPRSWELYLNHRWRGTLKHSLIANYLQFQHNLPPSVRADLHTLHGDTAILLVKMPEPFGGDRIVGYLTLDLVRLRPSSYTRINVEFLGSSGRHPFENEIAFISVANTLQPYAINLNGPVDKVPGGRAPSTIEIWRLSQTDPPERVASHPMMASSISGTGNDDDVRWVSAHYPSLMAGTSGMGLLIDVYLDSIYHFDPMTSELNMLFHPGGLNKIIDPDGRVAIYAEGARKLYVISLFDSCKKN